MPSEPCENVKVYGPQSGASPYAVMSWLLLFMILAINLPRSADAQQPQSLPQSPLIVKTDQGTHHFIVQLANTTEERNIGLMYRKDMAPDHGMLFDMGMAQQAHFWMKNTYLPLDIIFIRTDGRISNIEQGIPLQLSPAVLSRGRVLGVLELNAGTAQTLGIRPGDLVRHPIFGNWPEDEKNDP